MFWVKVLYSLLDNFLKSTKITFIICLSLHVCSKIISPTFLYIDSAISLLIFYHIGTSFLKINKNLESKTQTSSFFIFILILLYIFIFSFFEFNIDYKANEYSPFYLPLSLIMIFSLYKISLSISSKENLFISFLNLCGIFSLGIFGFHIILWKLYYPIGSLCNIEPFEWQACIIKFLIGVFLSLLISIWINKHYPYILGSKTIKSFNTELKITSPSSQSTIKSS